MLRLIPLVLLTASIVFAADDEEDTQPNICDVRGLVASHIIGSKRMFPVEKQFEQFVYQLQGRGVGNRRRLAIMKDWYREWGPTAMETWFKVTYGSYSDPKQAYDAENRACKATNNAVPEVTVPNMKSDT
jgi:hypothetical protein